MEITACVFNPSCAQFTPRGLNPACAQFKGIACNSISGGVWGGAAVGVVSWAESPRDCEAAGEAPPIVNRLVAKHASACVATVEITASAFNPVRAQITACAFNPARAQITARSERSNQGERLPFPFPPGTMRRAWGMTRMRPSLEGT